MCTMTWFSTPQGYELFFNRDERTSRSHADLPALQNADGVSYLSPTDADAGGTWIAVNHFGVTVCLLNHYQFEQIATYKDWISRGEIVRKFATTEQIDVATKQFAQMELHDYRAFRMFFIDRQGNTRLCVWDGHSPRVERSVERPKSSSSVDARHVKEIRKQLFADVGLDQSCDTQQFLIYHAGHVPSRSRESVCMHRDDASTVSLSHISVDQRAASFAYADGPPCEAPLGRPLVLPLNDCLVSDDSESPTVAAARC